jgi:DNA-binding response OmpR family regulator
MVAKQQVKDTLKKCRVLIVEDSVDLARRIAKLLKPYCGVDPVLVHSKEEAEATLKDDLEGFCLAIVDVMLPITKADFEQVRMHEKTLADVREKIRELVSEGDQAAQQELIEARASRAAALRQISLLIDTEAGIALVRAWQPILSSQGRQLPVLYLTAVGNHHAIHEGSTAAGGAVHWAVKPVPARDILAHCATLVKSAKT